MVRLKSSCDIHSQENDLLFKNFLERTFFRGLKNNVLNYNSVEFFISPACNLSCKYCYLRKYGDKLYPKEILNYEEIAENSRLLVDWLEDIGFKGRLELFSGEPTLLPIFFDMLDYAIEHLKDAVILIPTNMTFLFDDELTREIEERLKTGRVFLSASLDGKYLQDINRPFKTEKRKYSDEFWHRAFQFAKKWKIGFHPMIYSNGIELWKDNFLWFMDMHERYGIPRETLYLLEVRNAEWTPEQIFELYKFMKFLVKYAYQEIAKCDKEKFIDFILRKRGFNILSSPFSIIGRGCGCSLQSTLTVRLGDLAIVPCHRLAYGAYVGGYFEKKDGKIVGIRAHSPELYIAIMTGSFKNFPVCESCLLKHLCSGGCLGAQAEINGEPFVPIPSVCMMEHWKVLGILHGLDEVGMLDEIMSHLSSEEKKESIKLLLEVFENARRNKRNR